MSIKYELVLKIEGASLGEIDDKLVQAVGQRLQARLANPQNILEPKLNVSKLPPGKPPIETGSVDSKLNASTIVENPVSKLEKRKPGRPPKEVTSEKNEKNATSSIEKEKKVREAQIHQQKTVEKEPETEIEEESKEVTQDHTPSLEDAQEAITKVFNQFDMTKARDCLSRFGVSKVKELKEKQRADFISYCTEVVLESA